MHFKAELLCRDSPIKLTTGFLTDQNKGHIEMHAGHVSFTAVKGPRYHHQDQQAGGPTTTTKGDLYGLVQLTQDWL
jgi:hypothetical protein